MVSDPCLTRAHHWQLFMTCRCPTLAAVVSQLQLQLRQLLLAARGARPGFFEPFCRAAMRRPAGLTRQHVAALSRTHFTGALRLRIVWPYGLGEWTILSSGHARGKRAAPTCMMPHAACTRTYALLPRCMVEFWDGHRKAGFRGGVLEPTLATGGRSLEGTWGSLGPRRSQLGRRWGFGVPFWRYLVTVVLYG